MALDQFHEQNKAMVNGSGGAYGLTDNPGAIRCWMIAGPEITRITKNFEEQAIHQQDDAGNNGHHYHDEQPAVEKALYTWYRPFVRKHDRSIADFLFYG